MSSELINLEYIDEIYEDVHEMLDTQSLCRLMWYSTSAIEL